MGPASPLWGVLLVAGLGGALALAGVELQRALFPRATRAFAVLVVVVLGIATFLFAAQLTGLVGLLRRGPLAATVIVLALAQLVVAARVRRAAQADRPPDSSDEVGTVDAPLEPWVRLAAWVPPLLAVSQWVTAAASTLRRGFLDDDSIAYHMPFAARFAQDHDITSLHFIAPDQPISFYPANSELLHGALLSLVGNDLLSPLVNLGALGILFLAAWCLGEPYGRGHLAVALAGVLASSPLYTSHFAGSALVDVFGISCFVAAVVVLHRAHRRSAGIGVAALAAGIALGTKFTLVGPVGLLTIAVLVLLGRRGRDAALWCGGLVALGSVWYLRNLLHVGNPVPPARLGIGPVAFEKTDFAISEYSNSVASYLTDREAVREVYGPGLTSAFGRLWPVVVLLVLAGGVGAIVAGRDRVHRAFGFVAVGSVLSYLLIPGAALGFGRLPDLVYFSSAIRYGGPASALGLVLLPTLPLLDRRWAQRTLLGLALAIVLVAHLFEAALWWEWMPGASKVPGIVAALGIVAVALAARRAPSTPTRAQLVGAGVVVALAAVLVVGAANERWSHRYDAAGNDFERLHRWAQGVSHARIATAGFFQVYALHGHDVTNHVQHIGEKGPRGSYRDVDDCETWVAELAEGDYDFVVVAPYDLDRPEPDMAAWTESIPTATIAYESGKAKVYRFTGPVTGGCR